jgi:hypothetical protein
MSTAAPGIGAARWGAGHIALVVVGVLLGLVGLGLTAGGGVLVWADQTQRDDDGYLATSFHGLDSGGYAIVSERLEIDADVPSWLLEPGRISPVRIQARSGRPVFVGIGRAAAVAAYLAGVEHSVVTDLDYRPFDAAYATQAGRRAPLSPVRAPIWAASAAGGGTQTLVWDVAEGDWTVVVMNADGSRGVAADVSVGAEAGLLDWLAAALLGSGAILLVGGIGLAALGVRGQPTTAALAEPAAVAGSPYPADVDGTLAPELSRWLWLVKWFLAIPHYVVLAFLWAAFALVTIVAFFAILVTGRYPRALFEFNVGVLRWTWRVAFYATGPIASDRYPPFALGETDYPATLRVEYPQRLSRGLVLVKSWLLAIPHYFVLAAFFGHVGWVWDDGAATWLPSLSAVLTLVAGFTLLFRGRYPRDVFELLVGIGRWATRVVAYAALMRDEYPPFRLWR